MIFVFLKIHELDGVLTIDSDSDHGPNFKPLQTIPTEQFEMILYKIYFFYSIAHTNGVLIVLLLSNNNYLPWVEHSTFTLFWIEVIE